MANNRLYIVDTETGDKFCLAKSFGCGWETWHETSDDLESKLNTFLQGIDIDASFGCTSAKTKLVLKTENEEE